jgi:hypothetical protein
MRADELTLNEQLAASIAVANYRRNETMPVNGMAAVDVAAPATALVTMNQPVSKPTISAAALERVLIGGDLSRLSPEERVSYYRTVCSNLNLDPLMKPFEYLNLNGRLVLYALRACTDQLRFRDRISIQIMAREVIDDIYVVTAQASTPDGRRDESTGAVSLAGLKGEAKCNGMLKAETKAKRRVTLSLCGLGLLDETEVESIPGTRPEPPQNSREAQQAVADRKIAELREIAEQRKPAGIAWPAAEQAWTTRGQCREIFSRLREAVGEVAYAKELEIAGVSNPGEFRYLNDARACYNRLVELAKAEVA